MNYPTDLEAVEDAHARLEMLSCRWQARESNEDPEFHTNDGLTTEMAALAAHQHHSYEIVGEYARNVFAIHPEIAKPNTGAPGPALEEEFGEVLRTLLTIHPSAVEAAENLYTRAKRGDRVGIAKGLARCLALQDALVGWHRRLFACTSGLIVGMVGPEDDSRVIAVMIAQLEASRQPLFRRAANALAEARIELQKQGQQMVSNESLSPLQKACDAASAVNEVLNWAKRFCADFVEPPDHQSLCAKLLVALLEESARALNETLDSIDLINAGKPAEADCRLDVAMAYLLFAELSFAGLEDPESMRALVAEFAKNPGGNQ